MNKYSWIALSTLLFAWLAGYVAVFHTIFMPTVFTILGITAFASCLTSIGFSVAAGTTKSWWFGGANLVLGFLTLGLFSLTTFMAWALSGSNVH